MTNSKRKLNLSLILMISLFLSGCGGGGKNSNISNTPLEESSNPSSVGSFVYTPKEQFETLEYQTHWGLNTINASGSYALGASGKNVVVGVVDEAIDWSHHEFLEKDKFHPDSKFVYSGNREPTPLQKFHGSATSSIIAARKDNSNIRGNLHGVAYDAQIYFLSVELGSPPAEGEYEPLAIESFTWEYFDSSESKAYRSLSSKTSVINNSFGFTGQITDQSKEALEKNFPKMIKVFSEEQETLFVWAAGNYNGITDTSGKKVEALNPGWLAGLGYYFPELRSNNVAVVAVDKEGTIADFSNRCGVAQDFCIAAPGVGIPVAIPNNIYDSLSEQEKASFNPNVLSYLKENPNDGYLLANGTSFAAPYVTGSLAVLTELFRDNLSPNQILQRLFNTANKNGKYSDKEIYGQGLLDLGAAASPVGISSLYARGSVNGEGIPVSISNVTLEKSFGDSIDIALRGKLISMFDAFDAPFFVNANNFFKKEIPRLGLSERLFHFNERKYNYKTTDGLNSKSSWQRISGSEDLFGYRLHDAAIDYSHGKKTYSLSYGINPSNNLISEKFSSLAQKAFNDKDAFLIPWTKASSEGFNLGFSQNFKSKLLQFNIFSGSYRNSDWFLKPIHVVQRDGKSDGFLVTLKNHRSKKYQISYSIGLMNHESGFSNNKFRGAFDGVKDSKSIYSAFNLQVDLKKKWKLISTLSLAKVGQMEADQLIQNISEILESNFDIGIFKEGLIFKNDILAFRIKQEPRIEGGNITINLPIGRTPDGIVNFDLIEIAANPSGREVFFESSWSYQKDFIKTSIALSIIKDKGHIKSKNIDTNLFIATKISF